MSKEPKILEDGESTYRNGAGSMCGGVIPQSRLDREGPEGLMMAFIMDDDKFEIYKRLKSTGGKADEKSAKKWFKKHARSLI